MRVLLILLALTLSACTSLEPSTVNVEGDHTSHVEQHFGDHPTNYGFDVIAVTARWQRGPVYFEVSDGRTVGSECLDHMHEVFNARIGYTLFTKE